MMCTTTEPDLREMMCNPCSSPSALEVQRALRQSRYISNDAYFIYLLFIYLFILLMRINFKLTVT